MKDYRWLIQADRQTDLKEDKESEEVVVVGGRKMADKHVYIETQSEKKTTGKREWVGCAKLGEC